MIEVAEMRFSAVVIVLVAASVTGCADTDAEPQARDTSAAPIQSEESRKRTSVDTPAQLVFGPHGVGQLRLGMTSAEVEVTNEGTAVAGSRHDGWGEGCEVLTYAEHELRWINGVLSAEAGLEYLAASRPMRTPQGIGIGSSIEEVNDAFPEVQAKPWDHLRIKASRSSLYAMQLSSTAVRSMTLELNSPRCKR